MRRERTEDGDSDSSSVSFDSDADFELDFERVPEQARAKVLPTHSRVVLQCSWALLHCAAKGRRAVGGSLYGGWLVRALMVCG